MDHIGSLLPKVLQKRGLQEHATAAQACWQAEQWLAEHLSSIVPYIQVSTFQDAELCIHTQNSIAAQECQQISEALLAHIQASCAGITITNIRIIREK